MLGNMLTGKCVVRAGRGHNVKKIYLLSNIEITTKYFNNQLNFNGGSSRDNLPRIKNGVYHKSPWQTK